MVGMDNKEHIRKLHYSHGVSIRGIASQTGYSRQYVRKVLHEEVPIIPKYTSSHPRKRPVIDPFLETITTWLTEDSSRPRKQRHTASRVYERLVEELGFKGSESIVRKFVQTQKQKLGAGNLEVFIPLDFALGSHAQCDWGYADIILRGKQQTVSLFLLKLSSSRDAFVTALPSEKQEAFLEGHQRAFQYFGGLPRTIVYDNLKTAVIKILKGKNRIEQETFSAFRAHYLFEADFCNAGKGNEKGQVEGDVGFYRRRLLVPLPKVDSFEEINQLLMRGMVKLRAIRLVPHTDQTVEEVFAQEKEYLQPLPRFLFDCCNFSTKKGSRESTVFFDKNRYSVPSRYARCLLTVKGYVGEVKVYYENELIAVHPRSYDQKQDILDLCHYLDVLEKKPYALNHAKAFKIADLPAIYYQYLTVLRQKSEKANLEFVKILKLRTQYDPMAVDEVLLQAVACSIYHFDGIKSMLDRHASEEAVPTALVSLRNLQELTISPPDLSCFDQLLKGGAVYA